MFQQSDDIVEIITPLYGFSCDRDDIRVTDNGFILRFSPDLLVPFSDEGTKCWNYFKWYTPPFVTWSRVLKNPDLAVHTDFAVEVSIPIQEWMMPARALVRALRLFKAGDFRVGPTWALWTDAIPDSGQSPARRQMEADLCFMGVHLHSITKEENTFTFLGSEMLRFGAFCTMLSGSIGAVRDADQSRLGLATDYFEQSHEAKDARDQVLDLFVSLEALLLSGEEGLSFKLATRGANLLGATAEERRKAFHELKSFYDLRSKIIHGEVLDPKLEQRLESTPRLRELTRQLLLVIMGILSQWRWNARFFQVLDEMSLDSELRSDLQAVGRLLLEPEKMVEAMAKFSAS